MKSFQLKATLSCSKSPIFNCFRCEAAGMPPTARGSGRFSGATRGGIMQRRQGVCASTAWQSILAGLLLFLQVLGCAATVSAQGVDTASLTGTVLDPSSAGVKGARVTVTNVATGSERTAVSEDNGRYNLVGLPPGQYNISVDGGPNFELYKNASVVLTVGDTVTRDIKLVLRGQLQSIEVIADTPNIEPSKTDVSQTVEQRRIENLP